MALPQDQIPLLALPIEELPGQGYRRGQLAAWLYAKGARQWDEMTDLPKALRAEWAEQYRISEFTEVAPFPSQDGSVKYLFTLLDGQKTEAVYMPYLNRKTICISSMVGCPAGCTFCATGRMGFGRNLTAAEMLDQVLFAAYHQQHAPREIRNVVLMGMGEPLLNLENVFKALERMLHPEGLAMSPRRITLSTVGIPRGIYKMAEWGLEVRLALSLHAPDDETRQRIIPTAHRYSIAEIMEAVRHYYAKTKRRITLEYTLLKGVNDHDWQARALAQHFRGLSVHMNLIPWNPWEGAPHQGTPRAQILKFAAILEQQGIPTSVRWSRGRDVGAACGQLALKQPA
ncbi:23S rRNA (adenine(2503)-C(2))-methyltransferase RlmN [Meiothermus ruber]|jgi:23S rRNA (adenine2503-C2)-methyltransferase|uniref:Probable dual-specificity RNA methyltransferase RlmN n=1 Tax=Meiothermus ruber (strain ATCC 35948 / DSM 1279 / VKM B-1258 / 21) TaxID=504728 RepID=D3PPT6_MEIRD|nr:23S rRNA (adenine(2503)-C(2))-methyltransferase RlmN [Meiothermus ruber]ADD29700.1 radical SAM enzyme, Cfr family [Meiothermus ruber DSM 1279]AGK04844.1 ribosomal RNA large subunit methyltransferase N [Meiothermus ruber DSM 1279]MCL6530544.1 23S rRNA (adenine(2503)-C(2))-methyltransferase RlmN [Meiothermus ruber]MCX7802648.1 23S rRNA (adenine(2503)-C(2))-methyltransferase RlmN [Meiothermus ruber]GAO76620.1 radical SAM enzyme, Cfr family [Meiothermus ruber H328]